MPSRFDKVLFALSFPVTHLDKKKTLPALYYKGLIEQNRFRAYYLAYTFQNS